MSSLDYLDLCRLCLVKDRVSVPIFDGEGDVRQIFLKIAACLPVKVAREDKLPKKICDDCVYKVELFYQFWNTTANAEKQLLQWLGDVGLEEKQGYTSEVLNSELMKQEESENRLDVSVMQTTGEHQNNMAMNMMDDINLGIPIIMSTDQQITVPISSSNNVQNVQSVPGPSTRSTHNQVAEKNTTHDAEEDTSDDDNTDDECDVDDGLPVKEEIEDAASANRAIEPTTFVNVALTCDEAGPSGLQQQKLVEMPGMGMQQTSEGDSKSGLLVMFDHVYTKLPYLEDDSNPLICIAPVNENENEKHVDYDEELEEKLLQCETNVNTPEKIITESVKKSSKSLSIVKKRKSKAKTIGKSSKEYKCNVCNHTMKTKIQYSRHRRSHERKPVRHCTHCNENFTDDDNFKMHMTNVHHEDKPFPCMLCGKSFKTEDSLRIHLKQHNKRFICDICGISKVSGYDLRLHKKKHNQEYVTYCEICNKGFYTNQTLERHILTHTGEKPFLCKICNTAYASSAYLNVHMKSHGQREKHKCNICNFESHWKAAVRVHMKIHTGENQITCEICGKSVSGKTYLQVHMRIHSGEKPHVCEVCGKTFSVRKYLIVHRRTHTGERPYECKICQKRFTQQGSLNSHLKGHNEAK